ncbi:hypothetical protein GLAREA_09128 [Glarea lozoyensis ATCC 20868]|uniref:Uncharacterized protein n=1 Tax=Glarea lozoyensis (strain ATCC 20868 / MF5171) TaxID=1116229 RepID=S3DGX9_GLAL2|nr:uncharacterized protein GLAREA_09128 [Glarea lozoyensis ATCC 20868]EPE36965.1 hypothetical protein GLAREA_09128 [Glarea lozoyensis ATCC 20868]
MFVPPAVHQPVECGERVRAQQVPPKRAFRSTYCTVRRRTACVALIAYFVLAYLPCLPALPSRTKYCRSTYRQSIDSHLQWFTLASSLHRRPKRAFVWHSAPICRLLCLAALDLYGGDDSDRMACGEGDVSPAVLSSDMTTVWSVGPFSWPLTNGRWWWAVGP